MDQEVLMDHSQEYKSLLLSPLGQDMLKEFEGVRQSQLENAENADTPDEAYGFTKQAAGVRLALGHLQTLATILPKDEGGKSSKVEE